MPATSGRVLIGFVIDAAIKVRLMAVSGMLGNSRGCDDAINAIDVTGHGRAWARAYVCAHARVCVRARDGLVYRIDRIDHINH